MSGEREREALPHTPSIPAHWEPPCRTLRSVPRTRESSNKGRNVMSVGWVERNKTHHLQGVPGFRCAQPGLQKTRCESHQQSLDPRFRGDERRGRTRGLAPHSLIPAHFGTTQPHTPFIPAPFGTTMPHTPLIPAHFGTTLPHTPLIPTHFGTTLPHTPLI